MKKPRGAFGALARRLLSFLPSPRQTEKRTKAMSQRDANLLWLKDMLEHLSACQRKLEWAENPTTIRLLTETMLRDLDRCQRLCETLQQRTRELQPA